MTGFTCAETAVPANTLATCLRVEPRAGCVAETGRSLWPEGSGGGALPQHVGLPQVVDQNSPSLEEFLFPGSYTVKPPHGKPPLLLLFSVEDSS